MLDDAGSLTRQIAQAAMSLRYEALPASVQATAQALIEDLLRVAVAGRAQVSTRQLSDAVIGAPGVCQLWFDDAREPGAEAAVLGNLHRALRAPDRARERRGHGLAPADAAFANTLSAAALDYDSLNGAVHADLVTLPAAWAMAEHCQRSPRQMLTAYVAASELVSRLARCAQGPSRGWSPTSLYGGMGAALASGLLLELSLDQLVHALGLAAVQAFGTQQANIEQTLAKRLQPALAVRTGVQAALLAQAGASAPQQALEGRFGVRALYQPGDDRAVLDGWGEQWQLSDTVLKAYPVCACSHAAIQALVDLRSRAPFSLDEVASVTATISPFMQRLVGGAFDPRADLQVLAQFNLRYQLAAVLLRGGLNLHDLRPEAVLDPHIGALLPRIELRVDAHHNAELAPASVRVVLGDGRVLEQTCTDLPGSPEAPLSIAQLQAKTRECGAQAVLFQIAALDQHAQLPTLHA